MSQNAKDDFNTVCDGNVRRNYGGVNFLNLSCLQNTPDTQTYHYGMKFLELLPGIKEDVATPPLSLQKSFDKAAAQSAAFIDHARTVSKDARADPEKRDAAANVVAHPLLGMAYTVDDFVNKSIKYKLDSEAFGKPDVWRRPADTDKAREGDCEDYALLKLAMLKKLGFPNDKMWLMVGRQNTGGFNPDPGGHAVLMIEVDKKHYVMNNSERGGLEPLKDFMKEGRAFVPQLIMNGNEAFVVEDQAMRDVANQKGTSMMHAVKSLFSMETLKADWERLTGKQETKTPQFDF